MPRFRERLAKTNCGIDALESRKIFLNAFFEFATNRNEHDGHGDEKKRRNGVGSPSPYDILDPRLDVGLEANQALNTQR